LPAQPARWPRNIPRIGDAILGTEHILTGVLRSDNLVTILLARLDIDRDRLVRRFQRESHPGFRMAK
jgi:hypothetical protein